MTKEALKLALGKIKSSRACNPNAVDTLLFEAEEILETALAEQPTQQEPVAWRVKWPAIGGGYKWIMVDRPLMEKEGFVNEALYTSPPAQQEPVAYGMWDTMLGKGNRMMMVRLDRGQDGCTVPLYTSPPAQRTWVGLTDEEIDQGLCRTNYSMQTAGAWRDGVEWAIKQLREKNNG